MTAYPVTNDARQRLRRAQRAETEALAAVTRAQQARIRLQAKVDAADLAVAVAISRLVDVSGAERTAQLLDESTTAVRRSTHRAHSARPVPPKES